MLKYSNLHFFCFLVVFLLVSCSKPRFDREASCTVLDDYTSDQWYIDDQDAGVGRQDQPDDYEAKVVIVSDGLDSRHCDLKDQLDLQNSYNFYNKTTNPVLSPSNMLRGTFMAGLIAAKADGIGITGVAPKTKIIFVNILDDKDLNHHEELLTKVGSKNTYGVSLNTWATIPGHDSFFPRSISAIKEWENKVDRVQDLVGEDLLSDSGILYVFAGGDRGLLSTNNLPFKNSNLNAYANFHGVIAVCSTDSDADLARYSVGGANIFVCGPSIGSNSVISTDVLGDGGYNADQISNDYTDKNTVYGGDASAAIVAGVASLLRSTKSNTNSQFNWRDIKLILAESAKKVDDSDDSWVDNQNPKISDPTKNYEHSEKYGFGLVQAKAAFALAQNWAPLTNNLDSYIATAGKTSSEFVDASGTPTNQLINGVDYIESTINIGADELAIDASRNLSKVEFVEVKVRSVKGDLNGAEILLISPQGIESTLIDADTAEYINDEIPEEGEDEDKYKFPAIWRFGSVRDLGADPSGDWKLRIQPSAAGLSPKITSWTIKIYGR